tara:strand:- start:249 stop:494 length:246 start_codon:yes stop_codon:yes gene_type:complete
MKIINENIKEDKINVIQILKEYLNATDSEIQQFTERVEDEDPEDWTCGVMDELVPDFEQMRKENRERDRDSVGSLKRLWNI